MKPLIALWYLRGQMHDHTTENAICPRCGSWIRHRFLMALIKEKGFIKDGFKILHFAPEGLFPSRLKKLYKNLDYTTCDFSPDNFKQHDAIKIDITSIELPSDEFDFIICSHVLEHIDDDIKAVSELYRILRLEGRVVIAIPTYGDTTFEDPSISEEQREKMFGIGDHKRLYGLDFAEKLRAAGFSAEVYSTNDVKGNYIDRTVQTPHTESDKYIFVGMKNSPAA